MNEEPAVSAEQKVDALSARQLRVLVALAEEGTFTDAAIRLGMSQPAVSRALTRLEETLGTQLVRRTTRSLSLTPAGRACWTAAGGALLALESVVHAAAGRTRPLRLGYAWALFGPYTSAVLRGWRSDHPDVPLEVHRIDEREAGLARGLVDVAVRRGEVSDPAVHVEPLFEEGRMAALPVDSLLAQRESLTLADLTAETIALAPLAGTTSLDLWPSGLRPRRTVQVANTDEWLMVIASGEAAGVTAESTSSQHPHPGVLYVPLRGVPAIAVNLVWLTGPPHPALAQFVTTSITAWPAPDRRSCRRRARPSGRGTRACPRTFGACQCRRGSAHPLASPRTSRPERLSRPTSPGRRAAGRHAG